MLGNNLCRRACPSLGTNRTYPVRYDKDHTFSVTILKCPAKRDVCIKLEWETLTCAGQFGHDGARCAFCDVRGAAFGSGYERVCDNMNPTDSLDCLGLTSDFRPLLSLQAAIAIFWMSGRL